jgi:rRNA-processing protein FCF1
MVVGVFFDTNFVDNRKSAQSFWGGREALEKIGKKSKLLAPRVVHDEVQHHIKKYLKSQRDILKSNPYKHMLDINDESIDQISVDDLVQKLVEEETIEYEVIDLNDEQAAYKKAYRHAVEGIAPFEPEKDKGFKDTLIACTIDQYCQNIAAHDQVFFLTNDEQLKKYFKSNRKVRVISTYEDFDAEYSDQEVDVGLLERIKNYLADEGVERLGDVALDDQWLNSSGDLIVRMKDDKKGMTYSVLVDPTRKEPSSFTTLDLDEAVASLALADDFDWAEQAAVELSEVLEYLSIGKVVNCYEAFRHNEDIWIVGGKQPVLEAAAELYKTLVGFSLKAEAEEIKQKYLDFSDKELDAQADAWAELQSDIERGH